MRALRERLLKSTKRRQRERRCSPLSRSERGAREIMGTESLSRALVEFFPHLLPEGILVAAACIVFLGATTRAGKNLWYLISLGALAAGIWLILAQGPPLPESASNRPETFASPVLFDNLTWFIRLLAFGGGLVLVLFSWSEVPE